MNIQNQGSVELSGNPVSRANEDEAVQYQKRLSVIILNQIERKRTKTKSTIIQSSKHNAFENSRVTRVYFERYRVLEYGRFWVICATIVLVVLEYEVSFLHQLTDIYDKEIKILLYLIMILSIISSKLLIQLVIMTFIAYQAELEFKKRSLSIPKASNIFQTNLIFLLILETIILLPCPTPYTMEFKIFFTQRYSDQIRFYFINEILTFIMLFRSLLILNIAFKFQDFYSNRVNRLCRIYSVDFGPHFIFKVAIREHPYKTICGLFCIGLFIFSYQLEISERSLLRTEQEVKIYNFNHSFWVCMITIFTVGYGDIYPSTDLGRFSMTLGLFYGVALTSLFTAILYADLQPLSAEMRSITLLDKANLKVSIKQFAQKAMLNLFKLQQYFQRNKQKYIQSNPAIEQRVSHIKGILQKTENMRRNYRTIDTEDLITMAERRFKEMTHFFIEYYEMLEQMQQQQELLDDIDTPRIHSNEKSHTVTSASLNIRSKDDQYFEELIDSQSENPQLMQFNDED
ncbi:unnamed protein product [Paramecium pentaurelia]|uniref:Potassium channel domain-containing protein n=1 Tax=Paramecium pentaurelia TaxID=43138 RepID=A0A8S1U6R6_9CILI|nr:unnamed protein product [Paramecium pentaurelia]